MKFWLGCIRSCGILSRLCTLQFSHSSWPTRLLRKTVISSWRKSEKKLWLIFLKRRTHCAAGINKLLSRYEKCTSLQNSSIMLVHKQRRRHYSIWQPKRSGCCHICPTVWIWLLVIFGCFHSTSIRSLSLWRTFLGCFFDTGSAISQCGTTIEQHYSRKKWGEGGRKKHKAEPR